VQFPNSKFAPEVAQMLRNIQEVLADREFKVGDLYRKKGSFPASANRFQALTDQYPLYSKADEALWMQAEDYQHMGDRFEDEQAAAYTKIVRDYPLSAHADDAKSRLEDLKRAVPEADPVALSRMKYEQENREKRSLMSKATGPFANTPNLNTAAKSGTPVMGRLAPMVPRSVPPAAAGTNAVTNEVTATTAANPDVLDKNPDARAPGATGAAPAAAVPGADAKPAEGVAGATGAAAATESKGSAAGLANATNPVNSAAASVPQNHTGPAAKTKTAKKKASSKKKSDATKKKNDATKKTSDTTGKTSDSTSKPTDPVIKQ
jgi:outer membrane protein assembly factor BamD